MRALSLRQSQTLDFIRQSVGERGFAPTLQEIGNHLGIRSKNAVNDHIVALERKGAIRRDAMKSRAIVVVEPEVDARRSASPEVLEIPVVSRIVRGLPIIAEHNVCDVLKLEPRLVSSRKDVFGLRMTNDSMRGAGIKAGDYLFVRRIQTAEQGAIVVALIGDEAIVRRFCRDYPFIRLDPENRSVAPVLVHASDWNPTTMLIGVVVGVWRRFE